MLPGLESALEKVLGTAIQRIRPLLGRGIHTSFQIETALGEKFFVKSGLNVPEALFLREAEGLSWLSEAGAIATAKVRALRDGKDEPICFLVLDWIEEASPSKDYDEELGRGLAKLHQTVAPYWGFEKDNFVGDTLQKNSPCETWVDFYRDRRIWPNVEICIQKNLIEKQTVKALEKFCIKLEYFLGHSSVPSRLHGDLWQGNVLCNSKGLPCLIDPAVYGGEREVDIAMMKLFGGFNSRVFSSYNEAFPLEKNWKERISMYQLYPRLLHVHSFLVPGYLQAVRETLQHLVGL